jgi:tartrate-resistant acid phosphatase type 5
MIISPGAASARAALVLVLVGWVIGYGQTADGPDQTGLNLLVVGDCGFSPPAQRTADQQAVARAMADYVRGSGSACGGVLLAGDTFKAKIMGPNDLRLAGAIPSMFDTRALRSPFYAAFGNHDYQYKAVTALIEYSRLHPDSQWRVPDRWYRVDLPAQRPVVTVLVLDSNKAQLGKKAWQLELAWMEQELSRPRGSAWRVVLAHHPLFSNGEHGDDPNLQAAWGPVLRQHGVDLYVSGHDHVLQHLEISGWPMTFLTSGGGGENTQRKVTHSHGPFVAATYGFAAMEFGPSSVKVSLIDQTGRPLHVFRRDHAGRIETAEWANGGIGEWANGRNGETASRP